MLNWEESKGKTAEDVKGLAGGYEDKGTDYKINMESAGMEKYAEIKNLPIHNIVEVHDTILPMLNSLKSPYMDLTCRTPRELDKFIGLDHHFMAHKDAERDFLEKVNESPTYYTKPITVRAIGHVKERIGMTEEELKEEYGYKLDYSDSELISEMINVKPGTIGKHATIQDVLDKYLIDAELTRQERMMVVDIVLNLSRRYVSYNVHQVKDLTLSEVIKSEWEEDDTI